MQTARWFLLLLAAASAWAQQQPLPFSHKTHTDAGKLKCEDCHPAPAKFGAPMGFPTAARCMACHIEIAKDRPAIRQLADFAKAKDPIPWVRVFKLPEFVFFDHRYHLMNQATCEGCHGPVAAMDTVTNEINSTKMAFCQTCHTRTRAANGCNTCHNHR